MEFDSLGGLCKITFLYPYKLQLSDIFPLIGFWYLVSWFFFLEKKKEKRKKQTTMVKPVAVLGSSEGVYGTSYFT